MTQELRLFNTLSGRSRDARSAGAARGDASTPAGPRSTTARTSATSGRFVATDVLRRTLRHFGYRVREVMNITDVDDRIIQKAQEAGTDLARLHRRVHPGVRGGHGDAAPRAARAHAPGDRPHPRDDRPHRAAAGARPHLRRGRQRLLPHRVLPGVRPPVPARRRRASRPGRGSTPTSTTRRTRATSCCGSSKSDEPAWAQWDAPFGKGRPGLAHRVLGHEHEVPRRDLRPARGRRGPHLPAPRERDRPERVRDRASPSSGTGCTSSTC